MLFSPPFPRPFFLFLLPLYVHPRVLFPFSQFILFISPLFSSTLIFFHNQTNVIIISRQPTTRYTRAHTHTHSSRLILLHEILWRWWRLFPTAPHRGRSLFSVSQPGKVNNEQTFESFSPRILHLYFKADREGWKVTLIIFYFSSRVFLPRVCLTFIIINL